MRRSTVTVFEPANGFYLAKFNVFKALSIVSRRAFSRGQGRRKKRRATHARDPNIAIRIEQRFEAKAIPGYFPFFLTSCTCSSINLCRVTEL